LREGGDAICLIKPQFEVGKSLLGKGGIVRSPRAHRYAVERVLDAGKALGLVPVGLMASPIVGGDGNREFLVHFVNGDGTRAPMPEKRVAEVTGEENKC
jgi:23S rRNA (cytidine1920-2'-O)/16S rRNA (cytidine1409-2'-O)-methyltransferase